MRKEAAGPTTTCPFCGAGNCPTLYHRFAFAKQWQLRRCAACGLHFTWPQPTDDNIPEFYRGDYHSELRTEGGTETLFAPKYYRYRDWVHEYSKPPGRSIDIGCATGLLPKLLRESGWAAEGLELNEESVCFGRSHFGVPIRIGGINDLDGFYDLITMTDVLEHTSNPFRTLSKLHNHLSRRGVVLITFPDISSAESTYYKLCSRLLKRDWLWRTCHIPQHTWEFTPKTARAVFQRAAFEVIAFRRSHLSEELAGLLKVLSLPMRLLALAGQFLGTQMEFILRPNLAGSEIRSDRLGGRSTASQVS
jgi:2-polyprenyl-3-methyl-5-hydroxy-6-metoxy-1,4-benzoquinol methylase